MSSSQRIALRLLRRRKTDQFESDTTLRRCMTTLDLTVLGVGTVVGAGLYVVAGELARDVAGPAVIISFFIASVAAFLSALCYAEFGSRIPKAGSAYIYTYVVLGELFAFVVGWNMLLEYMIAAASLARSCSEYINAIAGGSIYRFFMNDIASWHVKFLGSFPDFLALLLALLITIVVCLGVKQSSIFNKVTAFVNFCVILFIILVGLYFVDINNWSTTTKFAPYGVGGILTASGSAFYAFVGFDTIATAGEEAINPRRSLPLSIVLSLMISFLAYFGVATILTLIISYDKLSQFAPLAEAFASKGFPAAKYVISTGAIAATVCCLMCNSFAAPRIVYSMASDGLLFSFFAKVNEKTQIPVRAAVVNFVFIGILAILFDVRQLVEMLSIGTLVAYSFVAIGVMLTRYQPDVSSVSVNEDVSKKTNRIWLKKLCCTKQAINDEPASEYQGLENQEKDETDSSSSSCTVPTSTSFMKASLATVSIVLGIFGLCLTLTLGFSYLKAKQSWAILLTCVFGLEIILSLMVLQRQPTNNATFPFMVPGCPYVPIFSLFINAILLVKLSYWTYIRFGVWLIVGLLIYGFYGYRHSIEGLDTTPDEVHEYILPGTPPMLQSVKEQQPSDKND